MAKITALGKAGRTKKWQPYQANGQAIRQKARRPDRRPDRRPGRKTGRRTDSLTGGRKDGRKCRRGVFNRCGHKPKGCFVIAARVMKKRTNQEMPCATRSGRQVCGQADVREPQAPRNTVSGLVKPMKGQTIQGVAGPALKVNP
ncbi:hypothetical protein KL86DES1_20323 [uncultured Desulfovibrio sp.]|uniref:Uncharacterized protein n=1 Tax=uncultured Desulfovibrio sp. TaxID=167968 RepID=A0A212L3P3_9BACT|nr:hypothetical protein KL86DES1_20323 [uncultured Desulfovibrio sp.]VZH33225.1 conserved protein of unknown function [Desulfovibrio sp. 86]